MTSNFQTVLLQVDIEDDDEEQEASKSFSQISLESPPRSEESIIEISSDSNTEQSSLSTRGQKRKTRPDQEKVPSPASKQSHRISLAEQTSPKPPEQNHWNEVSSYDIDFCLYRIELNWSPMYSILLVFWTWLRSPQ